MSRAGRWALALALVVGGAARFDAVSRLYPPDRDQRTDVRLYYQGMAESVLAGRGFLPAYPTNFIPPPGQAVFILIPKWLYPSVELQQLRAIQAGVSTLTIFLGFAIARRLWGPVAGVASAWLLALFYPLTYYVGTLVPETNYVACLFGFVLAGVQAQRAPSASRFFLAGALLGLSVTFKPVPSLLALLLVPWVWIVSESARRRNCLLAFLVAAWSLPGLWIVRNAVHYRHLYPVSTNGGTLLALANNSGLDAARADMMYWDDLYRRSDLFRDSEIERRFAGVVDVDGKPEENLKDRAYAGRTFEYIASRPLHFARNYLIKLGNFLVHPRPGELPSDERPRPFREIPPLQDAILGLGLLGMAGLLAERHRRAEATSVLALIAYLIAMGALMHLTRDGRMNLPVRALLTLPASYLVAALLARAGVGRLEPSAPRITWDS